MSLRKRFLAFAAVLAFCVCLVTQCASAAGSLVGYISIDGERRAIMRDGPWWYFEVDGTMSIYQYAGKDTEIVIPSSMEGLPVTSATSWAIPKSVVSLTIPGTFSRVTDKLLYSRANLQTLILEEGVREIGASACWYCTNLSSISLPSSLTRIDQGAFCGCGKLTSLQLSGFEGLTVGTYAFRDCDALETLNIGSGVTALEDGAFNSCDGLRSASFGPDLRSIGGFAFASDAALSELTFSAGLESIGSQAFYGISAETVALPATLKTLGTLSFSSEQLLSLDIPDSVTELTLPLVSGNTVMVVGENSAAHQAILAQDLLNYRLRGDEFVPGSGEAVTISEKIVDILAGTIDDSMDDYQKAIALHDYLTRNAQYDVSHALPNTYDPEGVLMRGAGVCQSYAEAYSLLLDRIGIANTFEYGDDHVWNMIYMNGSWYHVDVTWDDPLSATQGSSLEQGTLSGRETHTYFGLTTEAIEAVLSHECYNRPEVADGYQDSYAYRAGTLTRHVEAVSAEIFSQLRKGNLNFSFVPSTFGNSDQRNNYGIYERMSLAVARALDYTVDGITYRVTLTYQNATRLLTVHAEALNPPAPPEELPALTLCVEDRLTLDDGIVWSSEDEGLLSVIDGKTLAPQAEEGTVRLIGASGDKTYAREIVIRRMSTLSVSFPVLGEEAFAASSAERVVIGAAVESVGAGCFRDTAQLCWAVFQGSATVEADAFAGCPNVAFIAPADSPAADYAQANGIPCYFN